MPPAVLQWPRVESGCLWRHHPPLLQVGAVHSTRLGEDDSKTLKQLNFQVR